MYCSKGFLVVVTILVLTASLACGIVAPSTRELAEGEAPDDQEATPIPEPSAPGIDGPIVVEDITVEGSFGTTDEGDLELRIVDAYTEESRQSGDSPPYYPDDTSEVFLTLRLDLNGPSNSVDWVGHNASLVYDGEEYTADYVGTIVEQGYLAGWHIVFTVPRESELDQYVFRLPDGQTIELATFFD